jgi:hypothetical protein
MVNGNLFDAMGYFRSLCQQNVLAQSLGFHPCVCSGMATLPDVLAAQKHHRNLFVVDDTNNGRSYRANRAGFSLRRTYTVFLLMQYRRDDMADRQQKLETCRTLFLQLHRRMLHDRELLATDMWLLNTDNVMSAELGEMFIQGCTGLWFTIDADEPVNLCYDPNEWEENPSDNDLTPSDNGNEDDTGEQPGA